MSPRVEVTRARSTPLSLSVEEETGSASGWLGRLRATRFGFPTTRQFSLSQPNDSGSPAEARMVGVCVWVFANLKAKSSA